VLPQPVGQVGAGGRGDEGAGRVDLAAVAVVNMHGQLTDNISEQPHT
jgi:hypothetical protein